jgi:hypothetical protein
VKLLRYVVPARDNLACATLPIFPAIHRTGIQAPLRHNANI